jgi:hypothetical protein
MMIYCRAEFHAEHPFDSQVMMSTDGDSASKPEDFSYASRELRAREITQIGINID